MVTFAYPSTQTAVYVSILPGRTPLSPGHAFSPESNTSYSVATKQIGVVDHTWDTANVTAEEFELTIVTGTVEDWPTSFTATIFSGHVYGLGASLGHTL